jgi:putative heme-binding domain-containing protein
VDFPVFHLDGTGNRLLIAVVAVLHVVINHAMAVGAIPLITSLEAKGLKTKDPRWDQLAYRMLRICFIVTTTVGALTGVGIWFAVSLVNPYAIGSLIRIFYWAWFTEWLVFITEVCLILAYFLTWNRWQGEYKRLHIALGWTLALFSWITMALIVAILGFMMDPGDWKAGSSLFTAIMNPLYLPQLAFRTALAMVHAAILLWMLLPFIVQKKSFRESAVRYASWWMLLWAPLLLASAVWYQRAVPEEMLSNVAVAVGTQTGEQWISLLLVLVGLAVVAVIAVSLTGAVRPARIPTWTLTVPFLLSIALMAQFERVREFIRKPYVIGNYMYANGVREVDVPLLQRDGMLKHASYCVSKEITPYNRHEVGRDMFRVACSRCHTVHGMNSLVAKFTSLFGEKPWDAEIHGARPYMPPFPGNEEERRALAEFLILERTSPTPMLGDQVVGVKTAAQKSDYQLARIWQKAFDDQSLRLSDRQGALRQLADVKAPVAVSSLQERFAELESDAAPPEMRLDILEAALSSPSEELKQRGAEFVASLESSEDLKEQFKLSLTGGNPSRGAVLFRSKACISCHKVGPEGAAIGPELTHVAKRGAIDHLLESIVDPRAKIAPGYESITLINDDGATVQGLLVKRSDEALILKLPSGEIREIKQDEVVDLIDGQTAMPLDIWKTMSRSELRDVVAYLASLQ